MRHAKGIKGIRKFLDTHATSKGWHVFLDDEYVAFFTDHNVYEAHAMLERTTKLNVTFTGWTGNGITFTSSQL